MNRLNRILPETDLVKQNFTLNIWGELSGDGCKAVCEVLLHSPVSHLMLNIHGQLTDEFLRGTARFVKEQEKPPSITINAWVQMTEKENQLIKELGLDKSPSVSLNVRGTSAPFKESNDSKVISIASNELESLIASFEKAEKVSSKSLSLTINQLPDADTLWVDKLCESVAESTSLNSLTLAINNYRETSRFWIYELGEGLAKSTSLTSLTLAINIYSDRSSSWGYEFGKGLAKSTSLNSLTLAINHYSDSSSFWGYELGEGLAKSSSLNSFTLAINHYSDRSSLRDFKGLEKIKSLTECNFIVNICGKS